MAYKCHYLTTSMYKAPSNRNRELTTAANSSTHASYLHQKSNIHISKVGILISIRLTLLILDSIVCKYYLVFKYFFEARIQLISA
jgi:hypothetical protein